METMLFLQKWLVFGALAAMALAFVVALTWNSIRDAYVRANPWARRVFFISIAGITLYGGSKQKIGTITYPFTDPEIRYLVDNGSYVTNSYVHVAFQRNILVPNTATFYMDACDVKWTNEVDIVTNTFTAYTSTFAAMTVPFDFQYAHATNFNWFCYTDWTPPPVVHTNGVAYVVWQIGSNKATNDIATTRTGIYANSIRLAPNPAMTNTPPMSMTLTPLTTQQENNDE